MSSSMPESPYPKPATTPPLEPESFAWAMEVWAIDAVVVIEPGYAASATPALHFAHKLVVPHSADRVLAEAHWRVRSWWPRSWGRIGRVDLNHVDPEPEDPEDSPERTSGW